VARIEQEPDLHGADLAAAQLAQEIDSVDRRPPPFRDSALMGRVLPLARRARLALLESAGNKLLARLSQERSDLRELLGQSLRLSFEIAGREKELASNAEGAATATTHKEPARVSDDEEIWPFQGEYWRDELGTYQYQLGRRCKKPRPPPQTAQAPSGAPAIAAEPTKE
jgi:hypothetical protein